MKFSRIGYAEPPPIFYKYSERREQSQIYLNYAEPSPIFAHSAKIVKGEGRSKWEMKFHELIMPNRILSYPNIVKDEGRGKGGNEFFIFGLYRSLLYSINIKCMV